jgi:hypothetical protein
VLVVEERRNQDGRDELGCQSFVALVILSWRESLLFSWGVGEAPKNFDLNFWLDSSMRTW